MTETGVQVLRDIIDDRAYDGVQNWATSAKERAAFETERVEDQAILTAILARLEAAEDVCRFLARKDYDWVEDWEEAQDMALKVLAFTPADPEGETP